MLTVGTPSHLGVDRVDRIYDKDFINETPNGEPEKDEKHIHYFPIKKKPGGTFFVPMNVMGPNTK